MRFYPATRVAVLVVLPVVLLSGCSKKPDVSAQALYRNRSAPVEKRVDDLLSRLTLRDKIDLLSYNKGHRPGLDRLGVPLLDLNDGPLGIGGHPATCFPSGVSFAATWNPDLIRQVGRAIGEEARAYGIDVVLGPCVGIHRLPTAGRNFESYSEDPYLSAAMAVAWITGLQSQGVAACVKHYICNDQEFERNLVNVVVDERTLHEIYMPPFKAAVERAGVLCVMSAYNRVNGDYMAENRFLLTKVLKGEWGFGGFVVSDYGGTYSTVPSALAGLDMEMPSPPVYFGDSLFTAVEKGLVPESVVNDKARRILRVMFKLGLFDDEKRKGAADTPDHRALARKVAEQSIVLLKNKGNLLPLETGSIRKIAVLGPKAAHASLGGGGSSETQPTYSVSLLQALRNKLPGSVEIDYCKGVDFRYEMPVVPRPYLRTPDGRPGLLAQYYRGMFLRGKPVVTRVDSALNFEWGQGSPAPEVPTDRFSVRWRGRLIAPGTGRYRLGVYSNDGSKLYVNGKLFVNNWGNHHGLLKSAVTDFTRGDTLDIEVVYYELGNTATVKLEWEPLHEEPVDPRAVELARQADVALVCVGLTKEHEAEGWDRNSMDLPGGQARLIREVARVNPRTVVILTAGSPVSMLPWIDQVPAVLDAFYPGQEEGNVLTDILFGRVNPSGKLPDTFPRYYEDNPTFPYYPSDNDELVYGEGIYVGYRHYDARGIQPLFPFGFGLSYTEFSYRNLRLSQADLASGDTLWVTFDVTNSGARDGDEIVQLYVRDVKASVPREPKSLKGFRRVSLRRGETKTVSLPLTLADLAFYDPGQHAWLAEAGEFEVLIGASSRDIRLRAPFFLRRTMKLRRWKTVCVDTPEASSTPAPWAWTPRAGGKGPGRSRQLARRNASRRPGSGYRPFRRSRCGEGPRNCCPRMGPGNGPIHCGRRECARGVAAALDLPPLRLGRKRRGSAGNAEKSSRGEALATTNADREDNPTRGWRGRLREALGFGNRKTTGSEDSLTECSAGVWGSQIRPANALRWSDWNTDRLGALPEHGVPDSLCPVWPSRLRADGVCVPAPGRAQTGLGVFSQTGLRLFCTRIGGNDSRGRARENRVSLSGRRLLRQKAGSASSDHAPWLCPPGSPRASCSNFESLMDTLPSFPLALILS